MKDYLIKRIYAEAEYIIKTGFTVRATAKKFGLSKSTIHKDVTDRLYLLDESLYLKVKEKLEVNLAERHIRGGLATKEKYKNMKKI